MKNKIAFIVPYPKGIAPSQRFRFEQYLTFLQEEQYATSIFPFLTDKDYNLIYQPGKILLKSSGIFLAFLKRFFLMFQLSGFNLVFIHREASPIGPPIFEWIIAKVLKKKIIYDFDDAIWLENTSDTNHFVSKIKRHSKVASICRWSSLILCGNHFLMDFAKQHNTNVAYMPTTIDTQITDSQIKEHRNDDVTIGWTGTHSTIKYLYEIEDVLFELQEKLRFNFVVISNQKPQFKKLNFTYIPWNKEQEINDLLNLDIGIMPLLDNEWAKGKCGFKALQYMALEIPCIISPVGVNTRIIEHDINGYLAKTDNEWKEYLTSMILSKELRTKYGKKGRETIINNYSVIAHSQHFSSFIKQFKA
ncbi:MAG: group 1 glycosyl transferase [Flavobacteriales bacterium]|nr:MAG: group 1 glycosyl transferase [Flavobacteriales bacterium]